jgi:hypothetical protein
MVTKPRATRPYTDPIAMPDMISWITVATAF